MPARLLVIADDLTGALDTGVQLARGGVGTAVVALPRLPGALRGEQPAVVVDTESRHVAPAAAAERVAECVAAARAAGADLFYKKTDSTLRGNVGAELAALLAAAGGEALYFIPALPKAGRVTRGGIQLVGGVPLHRSEFARDPRNPVRCSSIPEIIASQSEVPVASVPLGSAPVQTAAGGAPRILLFDAETDQDLERIADQLAAAGVPRLTAGCSGFAAVLPRLLGLPRGVVARPVLRPPLLIVSGSLHGTTISQLQKAESEGVPSVAPDAGRLSRHLRAGGVALLRADGRPGVGELVRAVVAQTPVFTVAVFGGDTAFEVMRGLGIEGLLPLGEVSQGVVISRAIREPAGKNALHLITKAGGFGPLDVVARIRKQMLQEA